MLILDNTIKQVIKELICEYWDDDAVISNTRMDELTEDVSQMNLGVSFYVFGRLADQKNTWYLKTRFWEQNQKYNKLVQLAKLACGWITTLQYTT